MTWFLIKNIEKAPYASLSLDGIILTHHVLLVEKCLLFLLSDLRVFKHHHYVYINEAKACEGFTALLQVLYAGGKVHIDPTLWKESIFCYWIRPGGILVTAMRVQVRKCRCILVHCNVIFKIVQTINLLLSSHPFDFPVQIWHYCSY